MLHLFVFAGWAGYLGEMLLRAASYGFIRAGPAFGGQGPAVRPRLDARDQTRRLPGDGSQDLAGVRLLTRNGRNWTGRFPLIFVTAAALQVR
jgi:hypothetical protein